MSYSIDIGSEKVSKRRYENFILYGSNSRYTPITPMVKLRKSAFWKQTKQVHRHHMENITMARRPHWVSLKPILATIILNFRLTASSSGETASFYLTLLERNLSSKCKSSISMMLMYAPKGLAISYSFLSWFLISFIRSSRSSLIVWSKFFRNSLLL